MSRKGNCRDNAPVESFFNSLKSERTRGSRYAIREEARQDIFEYIACSTIGAFATPRSVMSARHGITPPGGASKNWRLEGHRLVSEKHGQPHIIPFSNSRPPCSCGIFHDTVQTGDIEAGDYREHRDTYVCMAKKRSRFFMVAPGEINIVDQTRGQEDLGFRFFEGAAAGSVPLGQVPDCDMFRRHFDSPEAVIELQPDGSNVERVISELLAQPNRLQDISRQNAAESPLRHDWAYRWREVLRIAGLAPAPAMDLRIRQLRDLGLLAAESCGARWRF